MLLLLPPVLLARLPLLMSRRWTRTPRETGGAVIIGSMAIRELCSVARYRLRLMTLGKGCLLAGDLEDEAGEELELKQKDEYSYRPSWYVPLIFACACSCCCSCAGVVFLWLNLFLFLRF